MSRIGDRVRLNILTIRVEAGSAANGLVDGDVTRVERIFQFVQKRSNVFLNNVGHDVDIHRTSHRSMERTRDAAANVIPYAQTLECVGDGPESHRQIILLSQCSALSSRARTAVANSDP